MAVGLEVLLASINKSRAGDALYLHRMMTGRPLTRAQKPSGRFVFGQVRRWMTGIPRAQQQSDGSRVRRIRSG
jgi:hypothetical protein